MDVRPIQATAAEAPVRAPAPPVTLPRDAAPGAATTATLLAALRCAYP